MAWWVRPIRASATRERFHHQAGRARSHIDDEKRVVEELKAEGIMKAVYRRASGPGVYLLLEGSSIDVIRDQVDTLPFVVEGLMTLDYEEIYEI